MLRPVLLSLALASLLASPSAAEPAANAADTARVLAGLPVPSDSGLAAIAATPSARQHAAAFDAAFGRVDRNQIDKVRRWAQSNLPEHHSTLFYFFSGPDFLYANAFFPDADTYILAGLELTGPIPDLAKVPKGALPRVFHTLEGSLRSILGLSFFQTKYMPGEFAADRAVSGTIPILYIFLARSGKEVHDATLIHLDAQGEVSTDMKSVRPGEAKGVKITFSAPGGPERTLYYFSGNVAGGSFKGSGLEAFCDTFGEGDALIKSASYLLQGSDFAGIRNFILHHSDEILQDDTGIPVYLLDKSWMLKPFGHYVGPIGLFSRAYQPKLAALYRKGNVGPLGFSISYRYNPSESTLLLASKQGGQGLAARPVPIAAPAAPPPSAPASPVPVVPAARDQAPAPSAGPAASKPEPAKPDASKAETARPAASASKPATSEMKPTTMPPAEMGKPDTAAGGGAQPR